jgi:hypothetical protein
MASPLIPCKERDFLDQDMPIRGQNYVCLSFLSPEDVIRDKNVFVFNRFLGTVATDIGELLTNLGAKFSDDSDVQDMIWALKDRYSYVGSEQELQQQFDAFKASNGQDLDEEYTKAHDFQTSVRGIKVRGVYDTLLEAENRVKEITKFDRRHHIFVGAVGCWCPWSPHPDQVGDGVYRESELNTLMKAYHENVAKKDEIHQLRKQAMLDEARSSASKIEEIEEITADGEKAGIGESSGIEDLAPRVAEIKLEDKE